MADLPVIQLTPSTGHAGDCGICAVATLSGRTYEDVVAIAYELWGNGWKNGLWLKQIIELAGRCGIVLKRRRKYDLESDTGILDCKITVRIQDMDPYREAHVVVLMSGLICDSDLRVWAPDAFRAHYEAKLGQLLEVQ